MTASFADNPAEYFGDDNFAAHQLSRGQVEAQQLEVLNRRFASLKDQVLPLQVLADKQGITSFDRLEDAVPLLFPHSIYKSYPEEILMTGRYDLMTKWLSRLTSVDLSAIADDRYQTMDDWMDFMDQQTDLEILHSSGTTGRMSFFPRGKTDVDARLSLFRMRLNDKLDHEFRIGDRPNAIVWTAQAGGRTAFLRALPLLVETIAQTDELFFPLIPAVMSSDHHYYVQQCKNLLEQGVKEAPEPSDYVRMRVEEAIQIHQDMPALQERLLDVIATMKYKIHVSFLGAPTGIHSLVKAGLERGMENMLKPNSFVGTGGGLKNNPNMSGYNDDVRRFTGQDMIFRDIYAMTELCSSFETCTQGHFHIPPWVIAYVLDAKSGKVLPREGRQKGRAAFFDLIISTYWGGVITGDIIEVDWGQCSCGRRTPTIKPGIKRMTPASDDGHFGPATAAGLDAAYDVLTEGLSSPN